MARKKSQDPRWVGRPRLGMVVRLLIAVLPSIAGVSAAIAAFPYLADLVDEHLASSVGSSTSIVTALASLSAGLLAFALVFRIARRFRPYASFVALDLAFPDRKPPRLRTALRVPKPRKAADRFAQTREEGLPEGVQAGLETVLLYVGALAWYETRFMGHAERVQAFTKLLCEDLEIEGPDQDRLLWAAVAHDIGKLGLPVELLNTSERLDRDQWREMQRHAEIGAEVMVPLAGWLGSWHTGMRHHHERWDGAGYPDSLRSREIGLGARVLAVADAFDAMTSSRSYQSARTVEDAKVELEVSAGGQFDPAIVRSLVAIPDTRIRNAMWPLSFMSHLPGIGARVASSAPSPVGVAAAVGLAVVGVMTAPSLLRGTSGTDAPDLAFTDEDPVSVTTTSVPPTTTTIAPLVENLDQVADDEFVVQVGDEVDLHVLANDGLPANGWVQIVRDAELGTVTAEGSTARYTAPNEAGLDGFWYLTCTREACGSGRVTITIGDERPDPSIGVGEFVLLGEDDAPVLVEDWVEFVELGTNAANVDLVEFFFGFVPRYFSVEPQVSDDGTLGFATTASAPLEFEVEARAVVTDLDGTRRLSEPVVVIFSRLPAEGVSVG